MYLWLSYLDSHFITLFHIFFVLNRDSNLFVDLNEDLNSDCLYFLCDARRLKNLT